MMETKPSGKRTSPKGTSSKGTSPTSLLSSRSLAVATGSQKKVTRQQLLDGGEIAKARTAVNFDVDAGVKMNYGMGLAWDVRLRGMLERENFFLTVLKPRSVSSRVILRSVASYFTRWRVRASIRS